MLSGVRETKGELNRDAIVQILSEVAPSAIFSEETKESFRSFGSRLLRELCELSVASSQSQEKSIVDTTAFTTALEQLDLNPLFQSFRVTKAPRTPTIKRTPVKLVSPLASYGDEPEEEVEVKPMSLFKKIEGHSAYVKAWIAEHPNLTFTATLGSALTLKRIMESVKESCNQAEINWECTEEGISVQAIGPSHVSLLSLLLNASGFESYVCHSDVSLGIHIAALNSFLKQVTKNDQISIFYSAGARECCFIVEDGQRSCQFEMKLKKLEYEPLVIADTTYGSEWVLSSSSLLRICRDLKSSMTGENIRVVVSKDSEGLPKLSFKCSSSYGQMTINCEKEMARCVNSSNEPSECMTDLTFSFPYLNSFTKANALAPNVELKFGLNCPLMCAYEIENLGYLHYYLAHKVDK